MQFELNNEFMTLLREHLADGRDSDVLGMIGELHPADLADILDEVKREEAAYLFKLIDKDKVSDVLMEMEEDAREELLSTYTSKEIAEELVGDLDEVAVVCEGSAV